MGSGSDEQAALHFDELASTLDAGLTPTSLSGQPAGDRIWRSLLSGRPSPSTLEAAIFDAAEQGGTLPDALRRCATSRRERALLLHGLKARLRYPVLLVLVGSVVSYLVGRMAHASPWQALLVPISVLVVACACTLLVRHLCAAESARNWPLFGGIVRDRGLLPYLNALHGLYEAGIPLRESHIKAATTTPFPWLHIRMVAAGLAVDEGRPLVESLVATGVLDPETTRILVPAEQAGDLSGGLVRAIRRREETLQRGTETLVRGLGAAATMIGFGVAAYVIVTFYLGYLGAAGLTGR